MNKNQKIIYFLAFLMMGMVACSESNKEQGDEHFKAGRYEQAVESYSQNLAVNPSNTNALYGRARAHEELGNYDAALKDFETTMKYDDRNVKVIMSMGDVFYKQKKFDNALYYYKKATELEPTNANALFKEGRAQHKLGEVDKAMSRYDAALRENKNLGEAYLYRGALKVSSKKIKSACTDFRQAQELEVEGAEEAIQKYCR